MYSRSQNKVKLGMLCVRWFLDVNKSYNRNYNLKSFGTWLGKRFINWSTQLTVQFKPFDYVTKEAFGQKYPTAFNAFLMIIYLYRELENIMLTVSQIGQECKYVLLREIKKRYALIEHRSRFCRTFLPFASNWTGFFLPKNAKKQLLLFRSKILKTSIFLPSWSRKQRIRRGFFFFK